MNNSEERFDSSTFRQMQFTDLEFTSTEYDEVLKQSVCAFYDTYTSNLFEDHYIEESTKIKWRCFECKKEIDVKVDAFISHGNFDKRNLFCEAHKPPSTDRNYYSNYVFQKYFLSFNTNIKSLILRNSKLTKLSAWKELLSSESTSQSTQQASQLSYRRGKLPKKKQYSFKSVLNLDKSRVQ